jgi:hypothetical protein
MYFVSVRDERLPAPQRSTYSCVKMSSVSVPASSSASSPERSARRTLERKSDASSTVSKVLERRSPAASR